MLREEGPTFMTSLEAPSPHTDTLGAGASSYEFRGGTISAYCPHLLNYLVIGF